MQGQWSLGPGDPWASQSPMPPPPSTSQGWPCPHAPCHWSWNAGFKQASALLTEVPQNSPWTLLIPGWISSQCHPLTTELRDHYFPGDRVCVRNGRGASLRRQKPKHTPPGHRPR